jgi:hypothetical protein
VRGGQQHAAEWCMYVSQSDAMRSRSEEKIRRSTEVGGESRKEFSGESSHLRQAEIP